MSYQTYITEAIVSGSWDRNTADKSILLFAREAGMVYVQAKSVRKEESKQRYALQDAFHVRVTLIRGKNGWKVSGAEPQKSLYAQSDSRESRAFLRDTLLLLRRLMKGEVPHEEIFDDVLLVLSRTSAFPLRPLKAALFMRIVHALGYVAPQASYGTLLEGEFPFELVTTMSEGVVADLERVIEEALTHSQL